MRTRIGAALMIAVAALLMSGEVSGFFSQQFAPDYMIATAEGHLLPLVVD